jgi:hypothetical protein
MSSSPLVNLVQVLVSVTAASGPLVVADASRNYLAWMNVGAFPVTVTPGNTPAVFGAGFVYGSSGLANQGGAQVMDSVVASNSFQAICGAGNTSTIVVWMGY